MAQIEICVDSVDSAVAAEAGGANRVELCSALSEGGLTPSLGMLRAVRASVSIGTYVMIRPRGGDFVYSETEFEVMKADIAVAREAGANGVVFGLLTPEGQVDLPRARELVALARPMEVTFHRAVDVAVAPIAAIESIIASGADRVLTSGGESSAVLGQEQIRQIVQIAGKRIHVMVGGGVRADNLPGLIESTGAEEWHTAARRVDYAKHSFAPQQAELAEQMGGASNPGPLISSDIRQLRDILDRYSTVGETS